VNTQLTEKPTTLVDGSVGPFPAARGAGANSMTKRPILRSIAAVTKIRDVMSSDLQSWNPGCRRKAAFVKGGFKVYIPNGSGSFLHGETGGARGGPFRRRDVDRSRYSACWYGCGHLRAGFHTELGRRHTTKDDRGSLVEADPGDGYAGSHRPTRRREAGDLRRHPERYVAC